MSWNSPSYAQKATGKQAVLTVSPSSIQLTEPLVAAGEIIFEDSSGDPDIVMAIKETVEFSIISS